VSRKASVAGPAMAAAELEFLGALRTPFATQGRSYTDRAPVQYAGCKYLEFDPGW
jgi:hypothetical protein